MRRWQGQKCAVCQATLISVDVRLILSKNVTNLMAHAEERGKPYAGHRALARQAKLTHKTIGRILDAQHAVNLDTLYRLAVVFNLEAWMLLVPDLNPLDPPDAEPITKSDRARLEALKEVARQLEHHEHQDTPPGGGRRTR
jgi:transcriptional regulator with XRE-family HTH domain